MQKKGMLHTSNANTHHTHTQNTCNTHICAQQTCTHNAHQIHHTHSQAHPHPHFHTHRNAQAHTTFIQKHMPHRTYTPHGHNTNTYALLVGGGGMSRLLEWWVGRFNNTLFFLSKLHPRFFFPIIFLEKSLKNYNFRDIPKLNLVRFCWVFFYLYAYQLSKWTPWMKHFFLFMAHRTGFFPRSPPHLSEHCHPGRTHIWQNKHPPPWYFSIFSTSH